jgi:aspartate-semialdehyde dehydrogenase
MRICILGATGLVGRDTLHLIDRAWPDADLQLFASRDKPLHHAGRSFQARAATALEDGDAEGGDLALVALDDDHSKRYVPRLLELGYRIVDKSNTFRLDPNVPLVVAGVNCGRVDDAKLVANPNCTTIPFAMAMKPLADAFGLESVAISTYQAISGAGIAALDEFLSAAKTGYQSHHETGDRIGTAFDPGAYAGNTVPHGGNTDESGLSSEERKLVNESRKILEIADLPVSSQCCRVPVAVGHYMNVWVTFRHAASPSAIEDRLTTAAGPFVRVLEGPAGEGLSALHCIGDRDRALVGRVRPDHRDGSGRSFCLTVAGDNLRLGAATNAVRVASRWFPSADPALQAPGA